MRTMEAIVKFCLPPALLAVVFAVYLLGWFSQPRRWEHATGWDQIVASQRPEIVSRTVPGGPDVFWLGHSAILLRWGATTLFLDPNTDASCTVSRRVLEPAASVAKLGTVDAALVSHAHYDHLNVATLSGLADLREIVIPRGSEVFLDGSLRGHAVPLGLGESHRVGEITVTAVPAAHCGNRFHPLRSRYLAVGFVIEREGLAVYYAGDTARHNDFARIRNTYHPAVAILPIGAYAPRFPLRRHHLTPEEAVAVARELGVAMAVPCHFGTYTLSFDRPHHALPRFARAAAEAKQAWVMPAFLGAAAGDDGAAQLARHTARNEEARLP